MSSFQLNISALTLGAKDRLARLDAAGGALKARLLSPPVVDSSSSLLVSSAVASAASAPGESGGLTALGASGGGSHLFRGVPGVRLRVQY
jgi:hypothetical protein